MMLMEQLVKSSREGAVAVEAGEREAVFFYHDGGSFRRETVAFSPFLLLADSSLPAGEVRALAGTMLYRYRYDFAGTPELDAALKEVKKGKLPCFFVRDYRQQALMNHTTRLFAGMTFESLRRLQLAVQFLDGEVAAIELADSSGWERTISRQEFADEAQLLREFVRLLTERDPDVVEGHNLCRESLPKLEARARYRKVALTLGRGGAVPVKRSSRFMIADRMISYNRYEIYGRQVVDLLHLAMFHDAVHREFESCDLEDLAAHFSLPAGSAAVQARALSELLSPSYFYQTQLLPLSYQDVVVRGNGTSLDALFVAEYLAAGHSLPQPEPSRRFAGALTRADAVGRFERVWHCDVRSLYPSILLAEHWCPSRDELAVFPRLLTALRSFRLQAKDAQRAAATPAERNFYQALQSTFKITINSFYGYLGFSQGTFNDYDLAEKVTSRGREILTMMLDFLNRSGAKVLELDTDGIYFQPPADVLEPQAFGQRVQAVLPPGIEVELDAVYEAMFSYKSKNYALLAPDGTVEITGAALKSRGLEPFQRQFMAELLGDILRGRPEAVAERYRQLRQRIEQREIPLAELAKTETLNDSPEAYQRKLEAGTGRRSAAYELALRSGGGYQSGDPVTYYLTGEKKKVSVVDNAKLLRDGPAEERDENVAYYLNKLDELQANFAPFLKQEN